MKLNITGKITGLEMTMNHKKTLHVSKLIEPIFKGKSHCLQDALESRQAGRTFKLVNPKQEDQVSVKLVSLLDLNMK